MRRVKFISRGYRRFGIAHPHELNVSVGYRGGIRK
ncbi:hypothetical protein [Sigmofec virus UA08Rod_5550]|uniref:Uncharacterized protein n=1 Tax=Sigmofec virus UA08Rod_5550 TaxID=2929429 RepID=A0A976N1R3_9VIRU|nr:hypothetical protein [Sigmofec virus UA08Rod_5550]